MLSHCPGKDGVKAYGPLVPQDVSPGDIESGAWLLFLSIRGMTPPSFESAGYAAWMVWGVLPYNHPHHPSHALWEWVLLPL